MRLPLLLPLAAALALILGFGLPASPDLPVDPGLQIAAEKAHGSAPAPTIAAQEAAASRSVGL